MKEIGARLHPNSGAGSIKFDGSDENYLYEHKDAARSYTMSAEYLRGLFVTAVRQGRLPLLIVQFSDPKITAQVSLLPAGEVSVK